ncbi:hypothetical protein BH10PAT2_BH10PAT2_1650 [soil metagenome]
MIHKKILVYCSVVPFETPPYWLRKTAEGLAKFCPVIFIDLQSAQARSLTKYKLHLPMFLLGIYLFLSKYLLGYTIILITTTPEKNRLYSYIPYSISCFDCTDQYSMTQFSDCSVQISKFNMVFTNSELLTKLIRQITSKVKLISTGYLPNGFMTNGVLPKIGHSVIFSGGISHRVDYDLLSKVIETLPKVQFFFMGEVYLEKYYVDKALDAACSKAWKKLLQKPNVHYLGAFTEVASRRLLPLFQVGIIPYKVKDPMNSFSHPIKLYEYLQAGLPIVSTALPTIIVLAEKLPISISKTVPEMITAIKKSLKFKEMSKQRSSYKKIFEQQTESRKVVQILNWLDTQYEI